MTTVLDINNVAIVYLGLDIVILCRNGCKTVINVERCNKVGCFSDSLAFICDSLAYLLEEIIFERADLISCTENGCLNVLQFLSDLSFTV